MQLSVWTVIYQKRKLHTFCFQRCYSTLLSVASCSVVSWIFIIFIIQLMIFFFSRAATISQVEKKITCNYFEQQFYHFGHFSSRTLLVPASQMKGFSFFSLSYVMVNWISLGLWLLAGQNKHFEDVTLESWKLLGDL